MSNSELVPPPSLDTSVNQLYTSHHRWLNTWIFRRVDCSATAADLAQDTFMRLLAKDEELQLREPRAFLTTIAKRVLSNHWRRERVEKAYLEALSHQPEEYAISPEEQSVLIETLTEIDQMLEGLPVMVRRVFFHSQLDGMKQQEIAALLAISLSTVKRYLRQASLQCYFAVSAHE